MCIFFCVFSVMVAQLREVRRFRCTESSYPVNSVRQVRILKTHTKLKLMYSYKTDLEHCCAKCVRCFDEYDHYSWLTWGQMPPKINKRFYCNQNHCYVLPNDVMRCFKNI